MNPTPSSALPTGRSLRIAGLCWAALHVPALFVLYGGALLEAARRMPAGTPGLFLPSTVVAALVLSMLPWLAALPASPWPRAYRIVLPSLIALFTFVAALDAQLFSVLGYHINGFFFSVLAQPNALAEAGVATGEVVRFVLVGLVLVALEIVVGRLAIGAMSRSARLSRLKGGWLGALAAIALLGAVERIYVSTLNFFGGTTVLAAAGVLPLQIPMRMNNLIAGLTGKTSAYHTDPIGTRLDKDALPEGLPASEIRFTKKPDIVFILSESTRADYFTPENMPRLWARAAHEGAHFTRHYSSGCSTYYGVFSSLFGLQSTKADAAIGAGWAPILFSALKANGYTLRLLAASGVEWMGMKQSIFRDVKDVLKDTYQGDGNVRDAAMLADARAALEDTPADQPLFLLLFFMGPHFNYTYEPRSEVFTPCWDGIGSVKTATTAPELLKRRARNAAYEVDHKIEELLRDFEAARGKAPLVLFTADHGEEFREKGHIAHGSAVTDEQIHVPFVVLGEDLPASGPQTRVTGHVDLVPTLFSLLGDTNSPDRYADGVSAFDAPIDRFVLATVGWEPKYAAIGQDVKVRFSGMDMGVEVTDPQDRPLPDDKAALAKSRKALIQLFTGTRKGPAEDTAAK